MLPVVRRCAKGKMIYLIACVIFYVWWALSYKFATHLKCNLIAVNTFTFLFATLIIGVFFIGFQRIWNTPTFLIGIIAGISMFICTLSFFYVIGGKNLSILWPVINLAVIIPLLFSIFLWKERPNQYQTIGLFASFVSLYLLGVKKNNNVEVNPGNSFKISKIGFLFFLSFLFTGINGICAKAVQEFNLISYKELYIFSTYMTGFFAMLLFHIIKDKNPVSKKDVFLGMSRGTVILGDLFFILSLKYLPGFYAFSVRATLNLLSVVFISFLIWKENLTKENFLGVLLSILAIILVNFRS